MPGLPYGLSPHRTKSPRQCDRCSRRARYNYRPDAGPVRYLCENHAGEVVE